MRVVGGRCDGAAVFPAICAKTPGAETDVTTPVASSAVVDKGAIYPGEVADVVACDVGALPFVPVDGCWRNAEG